MFRITFSLSHGMDLVHSQYIHPIIYQATNDFDKLSHPTPVHKLFLRSKQYFQTNIFTKARGPLSIAIVIELAKSKFDFDDVKRILRISEFNRSPYHDLFSRIGGMF